MSRRELFHDAWEQNILLVSPSTLLFVVRTVHNLYDKLVGFVEDLQKVGKRIQQAQNAYVDAKRKLGEGTGNVVRQAEMLRDLGVKPSKRLPGHWARSSTDEAEAGLLPEGFEKLA